MDAARCLSFQYADVVGERAVGQYMSAYFMAASGED